MPRTDFNWAVFSGADIGYVVSDALLDGGPAYDGPDYEGPGTELRHVTARVRSGALVEYDNLAVAFSFNWLSPEFRGQREGQLIGAIQLKYRF